MFRFFILYTTLYAGFGVASPFLPILLQTRGLRSEEIGLVLALSTAVRLVSGPVAGRAADFLDALRGVFACFAMAGALTAFGYLPANSFWSVPSRRAPSPRRPGATRRIRRLRRSAAAPA